MKMMDDSRGSGWVKPRPQRTVLELRQLINEREAELAGLRDELFNLEQGPRMETVAQIRNIMRAQQLTVADIANWPAGPSSRAPGGGEPRRAPAPNR